MRTLPANLNFDGGADASGLPAGWSTQFRFYRLDLDRDCRRRGTCSARLQYISGPPVGLTALVYQDIDAESFRGCRLRLSGWIRTRDVDGGGARLWMIVHGRKGIQVAADRMGDRPVLGTNDWRRAEIVLDVPADATVVSLGFALYGRGTLWVDELNVHNIGPEGAGPPPTAPVVRSRPGDIDTASGIARGLRAALRAPKAVRRGAVAALATAAGGSVLCVSIALLAGVNVPSISFLIGMVGISIAACLHAVVDPIARRAAGPTRAARVTRLLSGPIEEIPRLILLAAYGHHFGQAFALGLGWGVLHAVGNTAVLAVGQIVAAAPTGPAAGHRPDVLARNMLFLAVWQAVPQTLAQIGFSLLIARALPLVILTTLIHSAWEPLTRSVWRLPRALRVPAWLATGAALSIAGILTWRF